MIVKSMARKAPTFGQLIRYFEKGQTDYRSVSFSRNLYARSLDLGAVEREFRENFAYLPKRARGNALYHELIVLDQNAPVSPQEGNRILLDLAERYCAHRAPHQLVYGRIHEDTDHRHLHLMISANGIKSSKRVRLSKQDFGAIQQDLETYLLQRYPEVQAARIYTRDPRTPENEALRIKNREGELERRTKQPSKKRQLRQRLEQCFREAGSPNDLENCLKRENLRLYRRGKQIGVEPLAGGRKYRLQTLGLESIYERLQARFEREAEMKVERDGLREKEDRHEKGNPREKEDPRAEDLLWERAIQEHFAERHLEDFDREL